MRVDNAIRNSSFALLAQAVTVILKAITQIVFVRTLRVEYLGINGLFSNILTMLSLAELGVGSAILYNMYKPMAQNDIPRIKALMNFYRDIYCRIGIFVFILGISLTPFLKFLIKDTPEIPELKTIYILYVINNAISYFFVYKQSVFIADQKNYIVTKINIIKNIVINLLQIVFLMITRAYLPYLIINITFTFIFNAINSYLADKYYSYLKNNTDSLSKVEKKTIYRDVYALMAHKVGGVIVVGTDNLLLSAFVGVVAVGLYSNYMLILTSVKGFLNQVYEALVSSIGDLINTESKERVYSVYKNMFFISFWMTTLIAVGFYCLANPFIEIAFGSAFVLDRRIVALMTLNFYVTDLTGMRAVTNKFKTAQGLFWNDRYKPYAESAINLIASIVLLKKLGFVGILLGTLISTLTTAFWIEPLVLFKFGFKRSLKEYYKIYFKDLFIFFFSWLISATIVNIVDNSLYKIVIGIIVCTVTPSLFIWLIYIKTEEYKYFISILKKVMRKVI